MEEETGMVRYGVATRNFRAQTFLRTVSQQDTFVYFSCTLLCGIGIQAATIKYKLAKITSSNAWHLKGKNHFTKSFSIKKVCVGFPRFIIFQALSVNKITSDCALIHSLCAWECFSVGSHFWQRGQICVPTPKNWGLSPLFGVFNPCPSPLFSFCYRFHSLYKRCGMKQIGKFSQDWKMEIQDLKMRVFHRQLTYASFEWFEFSGKFPITGGFPLISPTVIIIDVFSNIWRWWTSNLRLLQLSLLMTNYLIQ